MVLIVANSNEDSQGTQLRISKKLTTVCSGKRSRFSKPRPNLSICKRGETNVSAVARKTSENSKEEDIQTSLNSNRDSDVKTLNGDIQNQSSIADADKKSEKGTNKVLSNEDANQKTVKEDIKIFPDDTSNIIDKEVIVEDVIEIAVHENPNNYFLEKPNQVNPSTNFEKPVTEKDSEAISCTLSEKPVTDKDSEAISCTLSKKSVSDEDSKIISSAIPIILNSEDIEGFSDSIADKLSPDKGVQLISNTDTEKSASKENIQIATKIVDDSTSKENNLESGPVKNSGSPLKISESEKRAVSSTTPTVIDKSKYPHLTSILSKKRTEPRKEVQQKRRRKFKKGDAPPERSKMTMADLIYWNPAKTDESRKSAVAVNETPSVDVLVEEENVDDAVESENTVLDSVPKLVISEDGQINIDQSSLFVSRNIPQPITTEIVKKDDTTYSSFRKRPLTKHWTPKDTANFYRALSLVGADFSLMEQIFPNRTRRELKQKFKREEKYNIDLINKVLYESQTFDELNLNDFIDQNSAVDDPIEMSEKADAVKEKTRKPRTSKKSKSPDNDQHASSIDDVVEETEKENPQPKKRRRKRAKKLSDDEDVEILVTNYKKINEDTDRNKSNKRKRNAKKLPDDFVSIDSIEDLEFLGDVASDHDASENTNSSENLENTNNPEIESNDEEVPSESACAILNKIMNGSGNTNIQQNLKEDMCNDTLSLPVVVPNDDVEYVSVEYMKNDDSDMDVCMLSNVKAYEVVNTLTPTPRKRQKINSVSPLKSHDYFHTTIISPPTSYTNYTPV